MKLRNLFRFESITPRVTRVVVRVNRAESDRDDRTLFNAYARRDMWKQWYQVNPVLARGEIGVVLHRDFPDGVEYLVIGDGVTPFRELRKRA